MALVYHNGSLSLKCVYHNGSLDFWAKEPLRYTFLNFSSKWRYWKFSNVIFSNFPIQRIPVLVKNSGGIYRRCYFCLIRTPKVTKKRLSEHFCHRWWPKGAIALQRATVTYCNILTSALYCCPMTMTLLGSVFGRDCFAPTWERKLLDLAKLYGKKAQNVIECFHVEKVTTVRRLQAVRGSPV